VGTYSLHSMIGVRPFQTSRLTTGFLRLLFLFLFVEICSAEPQATLPDTKLAALPLAPKSPQGNVSSPEKVELGRALFFDPILSAANTVSCATCHHPALGWGDGRATPIGVFGTGLGPARIFSGQQRGSRLVRNTPTVLNVGFNGLTNAADFDPAASPMFSDSRVLSLEAQVFAPIRSRDEMRGDDCPETEAVEQALHRLRKVTQYREMFSRVFDQASDKAVTAAHLAQAIASFERSLVTPDTPFDRFMRGDATALNEEQQRGMKIFHRAGCSLCHNGPMLSDYKLHFIAVPDSGVDGRREFRTPSLRNLKHTAPYMHNGSVKTLRDALVFYEQLADAASETLDGGDNSSLPRLDPLLQRLDLNAEDFPALEAYLDSLNAAEYPAKIPETVPSGLPLEANPQSSASTR
jgi:cytochrome c peroxidase